MEALVYPDKEPITLQRGRRPNMFKTDLLRKAAAAALAATILLAPMASRAIAADRSFGLGAAVADGGAATTSLTGVLEWVTDLESPHYEVNGTVLLLSPEIAPESLRAYVGQKVTVTGTPTDGPSIFMRSVLNVTAVTPAAISPVDPVPGGGTGPDHGQHDPRMQPHNGVKGASILFGKLERVVGIWRTDLLLAGHLVISDKIDLTPFVGHRLAAVVKYSPSATGEARYEVISVTRVSTDLAADLDKNDLYRRPAAPVKLNILGSTLQGETVIMGNGRTMLPLRTVAKALGAKDADIKWDQASQTATVTVGDRTVLVQLGSNLVTLKRAGQPDQEIAVDVAPVVLNGWTMVPLRVLSEGLGAQVSWDAATNTAIVTK
jgi:hypothetical protein